MSETKYSYGKGTIKKNNNEYHYPTAILSTNIKTGYLAHLIREYNDVALERFNEEEGILSKDEAKECWVEATQRIIDEDNDDEYNDRILEYSKMVAEANHWSSVSL